jgi:FixJ family two-component response regulator
MIKMLENLSDAVILVMTGHADEEIRKDAMLLGAAELIAKPFEHQQLISAIRNSVARTKSTCGADRQESPSGEVPGTSV